VKWSGKDMVFVSYMTPSLMNLFKTKFEEKTGRTDIQFTNGYNESHIGGFGDLIESASQLFNYPISNYDRDNILRQIYPEITTRKILLVGHSQGTFYTNEIYDYFRLCCCQQLCQAQAGKGAQGFGSKSCQEIQAQSSEEIRQKEGKALIFPTFLSFYPYITPTNGFSSGLRPLPPQPLRVVDPAVTTILPLGKMGGKLHGQEKDY